MVTTKTVSVNAKFAGTKQSIGVKMTHEEIKKLLEDLSPLFGVEGTKILQGDMKFIMASKSIISQLLKEVEVMREALRFYADFEERTGPNTATQRQFYKPITVARKALADCEKIQGGK